MGFCLPLRAQILSTWTFEGDNPNPSSVAANVTAGNAAFGSGNTSVAYATGFPAGRGWGASGWTTGTSPDLGDYMEVSLTAAAGYQLDINSITFEERRSSTGIRTFEVRSSIDGFASAIGTPTSVPDDEQWRPQSVSTLGVINNQTATVTFRIYGYSAEAAAGTWRFDDITVNGIVEPVPLPVELAGLRVKTIGRQVQFSWETTWEKNARHFIVQRSASPVGEFLEVGRTDAKGTTDQRQYYSLLDASPAPGANYYRLKQVDLDGQTQYSKVISVVVDLQSAGAMVYPNPTNGQRIGVRLVGVDALSVRLMSAGGQEVQGQITRSGDEAEFIPARTLSSGLYLLELRLNDQQRQITKIIVP